MYSYLWDTTLDPDFTAVYVGLAYAYTSLGLAGAIDKEEGTALAREAARKALELDPEGVEGNLSMARIQFFVDWDFEGAGAFLGRAATENPGFAEVHHDYSFLLRAQNRLDEAISELRAAVDLDPLSLLYNNALANAYTAAGRYEDAEAQFEQILEIDPGFEPSLEGQGWLYLHRGDLAQAVDSFEALHREAPKRETAVGALGFSYGLAGRPDDARECLKVLQEWDLGEHGGVLPSWEMALVHAGLGELDEAFEHLNDALEQRHTSLLLIRTSVRGWGGLREDPRFGELCTKIGLSAASLS